MIILMPLSRMKINIYKAFAIIVYMRDKGTSSKSAVVEKEGHIQKIVIEEVASGKMERRKVSKDSGRRPRAVLS